MYYESSGWALIDNTDAVRLLSIPATRLTRARDQSSRDLHFLWILLPIRIFLVELPAKDWPALRSGSEPPSRFYVADRRGRLGARG